jgi:hypothetical protein
MEHLLILPRLVSEHATAQYLELAKLAEFQLGLEPSAKSAKGLDTRPKAANCARNASKKLKSITTKPWVELVILFS